MTTRSISALLCGGLLAFMATAAIAAEERKKPKGIDIPSARQFYPEDNKNQKGLRIFDRWGNQIQYRYNLTASTDEKPKVISNGKGGPAAARRHPVPIKGTSHEHP